MRRKPNRLQKDEARAQNQRVGQHRIPGCGEVLPVMDGDRVKS
jgi:hypothetical protein